jgi:hypothetical protein
VDELSPRARALLAAARGSDDPIPADAARIRQRVLLRIGSAGFGAVLYTLSVERAKALLGVALPKVVAVALFAVGSSALYQHWKASAAQAQQNPPAMVAVPHAQPQVPARDPEPEPAPVVTPLPVPVAAPPKPIAVSKEPHRDNLEAEMRWVRAADAALRGGDVGLALSLLNQHAHEFPNGVLTEEREGLRVVAGCQGGASPVVERAATRFLQRAPRSLLAGRVRAACPALPETGS